MCMSLLSFQPATTGPLPNADGSKLSAPHSLAAQTRILAVKARPVWFTRPRLAQKSVLRTRERLCLKRRAQKYPLRIEERNTPWNRGSDVVTKCEAENVRTTNVRIGRSERLNIAWTDLRIDSWRIAEPDASLGSKSTHQLRVESVRNSPALDATLKARFLTHSTSNRSVQLVIVAKYDFRLTKQPILSRGTIQSVQSIWGLHL